MLISSLAHVLRMSCTIQRLDTSSSDDWGQSNTYTTVQQEVPCRWNVDNGSERIDDSRSVVIAKESIWFSHDVDIRPNDRIINLVDEFGRAVFSDSQYRDVEHVAYERNHQNCTLRLSD